MRGTDTTPTLRLTDKHACLCSEQASTDSRHHNTISLSSFPPRVGGSCHPIPSGSGLLRQFAPLPPGTTCGSCRTLSNCASDGVRRAIRGLDLGIAHLGYHQLSLGRDGGPATSHLAPARGRQHGKRAEAGVAPVMYPGCKRTSVAAFFTLSFPCFSGGVPVVQRSASREIALGAPLMFPCVQRVLAVAQRNQPEAAAHRSLGSGIGKRGLWACSRPKSTKDAPPTDSS